MPDRSFLSETTLLVADDDPDTLRALGWLLDPVAKRVCLAKDGPEAVHCLLFEPIDIVITDMNMPGNGSGLIEHAQRTHPNLPIIVLSSQSRPSDLNGIYAWIRKPITSVTLLAELRRAQASLQSLST